MTAPTSLPAEAVSSGCGWVTVTATSDSGTEEDTHESSRHERPEAALYEADTHKAQATTGYYGHRRITILERRESNYEADIEAALQEADAHKAQAATGYYGENF